MKQKGGCTLAVARLIQKIKVKERRYTDDIITVKEMMDVLAIGKNTAYKLLKDGTVKSFRIGKTYKVLRKSLQNYIYSHQ
jgi:excisionase family DNA binding protein